MNTINRINTYYKATIKVKKGTQRKTKKIYFTTKNKSKNPSQDKDKSKNIFYMHLPITTRRTTIVNIKLVWSEASFISIHFTLPKKIENTTNKSTSNISIHHIHHYNRRANFIENAMEKKTPWRLFWHASPLQIQNKPANHQSPITLCYHQCKITNQSSIHFHHHFNAIQNSLSHDRTDFVYKNPRLFFSPFLHYRRNQDNFNTIQPNHHSKISPNTMLIIYKKEIQTTLKQYTSVKNHSTSSWNLIFSPPDYMNFNKPLLSHYKVKPQTSSWSAYRWTVTRSLNLLKQQPIFFCMILLVSLCISPQQTKNKNNLASQENHRQSVKLKKLFEVDKKRCKKQRHESTLYRFGKWKKKTLVRVDIFTCKCFFYL